MNILFLDIDGVLNSFNWLRRMRHLNEPAHRELYYEIDPKLVQMLADFINEYDVYLVISSSRKNSYTVDEIRDILCAHSNMDGSRVKDITPITQYNNKAHEIQSWISVHGANQYAVIDDDNIAEHHPFVRTDPNVGLTMYDIENLKSHFWGNNG